MLEKKGGGEEGKRNGGQISENRVKVQERVGCGSLQREERGRVKGNRLERQMKYRE